jgi:hypothetical protein
LLSQYEDVLPLHRQGEEPIPNSANDFYREPMKTTLRLSLLLRAMLILTELALACVPAAASPHDKYAQYSEASANSGAAILSTSDRVVKQVQVTLRGLGYYTGPITGFMGPKTQIAIQMFEVDHCYPVKPEINRRLLIWLSK